VWRFEKKNDNKSQHAAGLTRDGGASPGVAEWAYPVGALAPHLRAESYRVGSLSLAGWVVAGDHFHALVFFFFFCFPKSHYVQISSSLSEALR
jgi:hypothetical protein